ncbi:MAG: hypothetical protein GF398_21660 [Chitinivibrionales bacterium]|nr:hypothetical protein [Chitinivibrionales bacterium]
MNGLRMLLVLLLVAGALISCGDKKEGLADDEFKQLAETKADSANKDEYDIFDEFYSEEDQAGTQKSSSFTNKETFSPVASSGTFADDGRYVVQISCVRSQRFANSLVNKLEQKGYPAYVAEVSDPTPSLSGTYYRVRIGGFTGVSAARSFGENTLVPDGYEYWVDNKSNDNVGMEGYGLGSGSSYSSDYEEYGSESFAPTSTPTQSEPEPAATTSQWEAQPEPAPPAPEPEPELETPAQSPPAQTAETPPPQPVASKQPDQTESQPSAESAAESAPESASSATPPPPREEPAQQEETNQDTQEDAWGDDNWGDDWGSGDSDW